MKMEGKINDNCDDIEIQMLQQKLEVPRLRCPSKKEVTYVCTNDSCKAKSAFYCGVEDCPSCSNLHFNCTELRLGKLTTMIQGRI
jgi:hypothetical protein